MVHNVDAKNFIKKILGDYLDIQYDNCVIWAGDLNGFTGNNEGKKIAEKFYTKNVLQYSPDPKRQCLPTTTVTLSTECVKF